MLVTSIQVPSPTIVPICSHQKKGTSKASQESTRFSNVKCWPHGTIMTWTGSPTIMCISLRLTKIMRANVRCVTILHNIQHAEKHCTTTVYLKPLPLFGATIHPKPEAEMNVFCSIVQSSINLWLRNKWISIYHFHHLMPQQALLSRQSATVLAPAGIDS
jgi:hypothetical protein